ncbi:hypothetical protein [Aquimarina sp. MMG016]|uniref:DUF6973 domain-containing protein n=1 Tax=Aquimarina sp. MMG016 TaxID=2822690 RepID=UPI001B3A7050|nr:hypothetical protein [Aquimarina sp. MMG016]MBQ4822055.1 hypothetical protein [Aquimarina sp. MMG016]
MRIWSVLKKLSLQELFLLAVLMLRKPLLIFPTLKATKLTMSVCDNLYGKAHHANGKENAFRHALWNLLICQKVFKITKNVEKSIAWAQKVTDLHEKLAPNPPLEEAMDLHNNVLGRNYFISIQYVSEEETIAFLIKKIEEAQSVSTIGEIDKHKNVLVYLLE